MLALEYILHTLTYTSLTISLFLQFFCYLRKTGKWKTIAMARTRPLFYSVYNLHAMFCVASLAQKVNVDIWKYKDENSRLRAGLDFLSPYSDPEKKWPQTSIGVFNRMEMFSILQMADRVYPDGKYLKMAEKLPLGRRRIQRSNLVLPVMR